ncbi:MAG TPA: pyruvate dehydrogenase (acetyl-transferring) E1 component subunit alpha [Gammaproteobacteria bacterium]|nr:pyruvate dehydrogenase (acetyl-transferring) E1 component subunit alpha [Gammaproteobacteria bacterium]
MKIVAQFEIPYYQYLNEQHQLSSDAPLFAKEPENLVRLYRQMVWSRTFDTKAIALQRTGKMGTYPSTRGQEAVFVGMGDAIPKDDIFVPYYRDVATLIQRGVNPVDILMYWGGDERGNTFANAYNNFPYAVPIGTQILHAVGVASALTIRQEKRAVLTVCGDGGTSEGDFYEAMNVAGVWKLPVVFVVSNNQWAISVPRSEQTAAKTLAQKAIAAGFSGEQVDGNDVIAVRCRVAEAMKKARDQHEPTLIEMVCYRQSDHTTADDASRYEPKNSREEEWKKEPIIRLRHYLESINAWSPEKEEALLSECSLDVERIVQEYLSIPPAEPVSMFDYLYETLPEIYAKQRDSLIERGI